MPSLLLKLGFKWELNLLNVVITQVAGDCGVYMPLVHVVHFCQLSPVVSVFWVFFACPVWYVSNQNYCLRAKKDAQQIYFSKWVIMALPYQSTLLIFIITHLIYFKLLQPRHPPGKN